MPSFLKVKLTVTHHSPSLSLGNNTSYVLEQGTKFQVPVDVYLLAKLVL